MDNKFTTVAMAIVKIEIRTMGLDTFSPFLLFLLKRLDMKKTTDNLNYLIFQKYTMKLSCMLILCFVFTACGQVENAPDRTFEHEITDQVSIMESKKTETIPIVEEILVGAESLDEYLPKLIGKSVAIVGNQTSCIQQKHLVDTLLEKNVNIVRAFCPEHGFRGAEDAGKKIENSKDEKTGISIISLYGSNKKPTSEQLKDLDVVLFDIQDVGVRFYTYISTLHYVMEACAENKVKLIVLDRPNPNAHYIDGPVLDPKYKSFVGMHEVPIVYGMTIGEYARMVNGEGWLSNGIRCDLEVITLKNYTHNSAYSLPIPPSPNLKSDRAIALYPSLCLFEGTTVSVGRGTDRPFEQFGHPNFPKQLYKFKPKSMAGASTPLHKDVWCYGFDLRPQPLPVSELNLHYFMEAKKNLSSGIVFINRSSFFDKLAGTNTLRLQLLAGKSDREIKASWEKDLTTFKEIRAKYLLYD